MEGEGNNEIGNWRKSMTDSVICENGIFVSKLTACESIRISDEVTIKRTAIVTQILASGIVKYVHIAAFSERSTGILTWVFTTAPTLCQEKML